MCAVSIGDCAGRQTPCENAGMDRATVLRVLREHEPELRAAGIVRLRVFGSVARGEETPESDVDLLADFDEERTWTLFKLGGVHSMLSDLLGTDVDLASVKRLKEQMRERVLQESIVAF